MRFKAHTLFWQWQALTVLSYPLLYSSSFTESQPARHGSSEVYIKAQIVQKIIRCLLENQIKVCEIKPDIREVKACADASVEGPPKVCEFLVDLAGVLDQIFNTLFQVRGIVCFL
ncbi:hypothetical protein RF11_01894 [Thelohanellus kitauei]|uniref:Uncharacterized protein n=1 Tax=Thelohanellus kitauei TaxID=669202 RepID=A0A0C2J7A6_THEKT|nr:hypothetical protein RF11_01890 [Thelohanellus kitauei]KII73688.1 hypothetical protein RF11_01894 [Thelohanellus kitauei]